jgi:hypothetical protein
MEFAAARERFHRERDQAITSCWMMAALSRAKDFPPLQRVLGTPSKPQTVQEQRTALTMIFGHGGRPATQKQIAP